MTDTTTLDEPVIVRLSKQFACRLKKEASGWTENAIPLACRLVEPVQVAAEKLEAAHWSGRREVLRDAFTRGLDAMGSTQQLLETALAEQLLSAEKHSRLEARLYQLRRLINYVLGEMNQRSSLETD
jgi:hypothetical protein